MNSSNFEPQTAFEGFLKGQIEEVFHRLGTIDKSIVSINGIKDDIVVMESELKKKIGCLDTKIGKIKGWILGISLGFGFLGGVLTVILRGLLMK